MSKKEKLKDLHIRTNDAMINAMKFAQNGSAGRN